MTFGAVKEKEYTLLEQGEYVLTLSELEETAGQWGDRMVWKFLVAPKEDYSAYLCKPSGDEYTLWAFTDVDIILGSLAHDFVEALTGRKFGQGAPPPDEDDLLGKRLIAYVGHETPTRGKSAGKKREVIVPSSIKAWKGQQPAAKLDPKAGRAEPDEDDAGRAALVERAQKIVGRAVKLETPSHGEWIKANLPELSEDALQMVIRDAQAEVDAALDG